MYPHLSRTMLSIIAILLLGVLACNSPTGFPEQDKKGSCAGSEDCSANQKCVNTVCVVSSRPKAPLPWDALPLCKHGDTRPCYDGPKGTLAKGICKAGVQSCKDGKWEAACVGTQAPRAEECNGADDDCNGKIDDGVPGLGEACTIPGAQGPCKDGKRACTPRGLGCKGSYAAKDKETCGNGVDDDCNGKTDDGCACKTPNKSELCYDPPKGCTKTDKGYDCNSPCQAGSRICLPSGTWGECVGDKGPQLEECNNKDDDCDGQIDGHSRRCFTATAPDGTDICKKDRQGALSGECKGSCATGNQRCNGGVWQACTGEIKPQQEVCNGKDDDCDGDIDEDQVFTSTDGKTMKLGEACAVGVGACHATGVIACDLNTLSAGCNASPGLPKAEECDGKDNDCDGKVDESPSDPNAPLRGLCHIGGCTLQPASGQATCKGICRAGYRTCQQGQWSVCQNAQGPTSETDPGKKCNGLDDDCDGTTDEGQSCTCSPHGKTELCFSKTAGCVLDPRRGAYKCEGECKTGVRKCDGGQWGSCIGERLPADEVCDGLDNNCDGKTDEYDPKLGKTCVAPGQKGLCLQGQYFCSNKKLECKSIYKPKDEVCDGKDNNCDGYVDEICGGKHDYIQLSKSGVQGASRNFSMPSSSRTWTLYHKTLASPCSKRILLATVSGREASSASYYCDASGNFVVRTYEVKKASITQYNMAPEPLAVHAVMPNGGVYGLVDCNKSSPLLMSNSNVTVSCGRSDNWVYIIHDSCKDKNQPIFATLYDPSNGGYITSWTYGTLNGKGECKLRTFDAQGKAAKRKFSFWLPDRSVEAWAKIRSDGRLHVDNGKEAQLSEYGVTRVKWLSSYGTAGGSHYKASFPSFTRSSGIVLMPGMHTFSSNILSRLSHPYAVSFGLAGGASGLPTYVYLFRKGTLAPSRGIDEFNILYVRPD